MYDEIPFFNRGEIESDGIIDPDVDYTCIGLFRDEICAVFNEDVDDEYATYTG